MNSNSRRSSSLMIIALSALVGFAAVYFILARHDNAGVGTKSENAAEGGSSMAAFITHRSPKPLPPIAFKDGAGNDVKLSDFKGRTILLNFWATWCLPCREEMSSLDRLQREMGSDKFQVVALSLDRQGVSVAQKFLDDVKATALKLYIDDTATQGSALKIVGMPTTILINRDGLEVGRLAGPAHWDAADAKQLIQSELDK